MADEKHQPTPPIPSNGWSRYEYAVLTKLKDIEEFVSETRGFMLDVRTHMSLHSDHPTRLARLEIGASERDRKISLIVWKVGALAAIGGALVSGFIHFLFSGTSLGALLGIG